MLKFNDFQLFHLDKVDSTNKVAIEKLNEYPHNFIVIADEQTSGKTTKSNIEWKSPIGNLYFSFVIKIPSQFNKFFQLISFISSLSIVEVIKVIDTNVDIKIKWPNDVLLNMKKISGILIEKYMDFAIIGIGVNIKSFPIINAKFPPTSLFDENIHIDKDEFAFLLANRLIENLNIAFDDNFTSITKQILPFMYKINQNVSLLFNNKIYSGIFIGIENNGAIKLKHNDTIQSFLSADLLKDNFI